jgi:VanZ family protein
MVFIRVTLLAALFSIGGELFQVFTHYRIASVTDVCSNVIGAAIGVAIAMKLIKRGKVHRFSYKGNS